MDCRTVEFKLMDLAAKDCNGKDMHSKVLNAAYMCQHCPAISDDLQAFKKEVCPCRFDVESPPVAGSPVSVGAGTAVSIRRREGRIGGTFMEIRRLRPAAFEVPSEAPAPTREPTPTVPRPSKRVPSENDLTFFPEPAKPTRREIIGDREPAKLWLPVTPKQRPKPDPTPAPATDASHAAPGNAGAVRAKLLEAERELKKLYLLKALQDERKQLERLLLQKAERATTPSSSLCS